MDDVTSAPTAAAHREGRPDSLLSDHRLTEIGLLFEVATALMDVLSAHISEHGLSGSELEVLLRLSRSPGGQLRMSDLARQTGLSASGLTRLVDRLVGRGLVARLACPTDRRGSFAAVTGDGRALIGDLLPGHLDLIERWFTSAMDPTLADSLSDALRAVRARVRPDADAGAAEGCP